jgi:hypothetical protein
VYYPSWSLAGALATFCVRGWFRKTTDIALLEETGFAWFSVLLGVMLGVMAARTCQNSRRAQGLVTVLGALLGIGGLIAATLLCDGDAWGLPLWDAFQLWVFSSCAGTFGGLAFLGGCFGLLSATAKKRGDRQERGEPAVM